MKYLPDRFHGKVTITQGFDLDYFSDWSCEKIDSVVNPAVYGWAACFCTLRCVCVCVCVTQWVIWDRFFSIMTRFCVLWFLHRTSLKNEKLKL